ncbi:MAG: AAA+ family ATPase [Pseudomonadota bacterium]
MKHIAIYAVAFTLATPALSDEGETPFRDGLDLFGEGAQIILEGLREEMDPLLDEMQPFLEEEMLPFLRSLGDMIDDITVYEMPERLPNGDIIIRRSPDAPPWENDTDADGGDGIEL